MAEAVKVIVRCRPMNSRENGLNCKEVIKMDSKIAQCAIVNPSESHKTPPKSFTFDGAYGTDSTTEAIYEDIGYPLVDGVLEGYNGTIFAYGQTGCGKSFSMQGISDPATQRGIIPRAFDHIFEAIQMAEGVKFLVHASYLEIYNEEIRDLLGQDAKKKLDLKEHPDRGVYCQSLSMHPCKSVRDCEKIMDKGWKNRATGSTLMNAESSRSHSIFSIHMERCESDETGEEHIRAAKLNLVDLAGSERQAKTGATGNRLKEATKINLSLSALGNVISALVDGKSKHIPYRDSKLTRLLQDSLGGNTKTLMVACLSPADNNYDESLSTLRYANRAKNIKNKPKINEDPKDALLREFQDEITKLKAMLRGEIPVQLDGESTGPIPKAAAAGRRPSHTAADAAAIETEKERLHQEFESERTHMRQQFEAMKMSKENLEAEMSTLQEQYQTQVASVESGEYVTSPCQSPREKVTKPSPASAMDMQEDAEPCNQTGLHAKQNGQSVNKPDVNSLTVNGHVENGLRTNSDLSVENGASTYRILTGKPGEELVSVTSGEGHVGMDVEYDEEGEALVPSVQSSAQQAVHLGTVKQEYEEGGTLAPCSSPTSHELLANPKHQEALKRNSIAETEAIHRLQELQQAMVGGEQVDNEKLREKHKKKKKHAEESKRKLQEALAKMDGEDIMLHIYDNVQDELKAKNKVLTKEREKTEAMRQEVLDLQSEFEFDRIDYLDTMRKQEQEIKYYKSLIDRIHPCLRRDCNYVNLDRIKANSEYDSENQRWTLPKMTIEKNHLPPAGVMPGARQEAPPSYGKTNGDVQPSIYDDLRSEDKYLEKLNNRNSDNDYFRSKRADKLLQRTDDDKRRGLRNSSPNGVLSNGHGMPLSNLAPSTNSGTNWNPGQMSMDPTDVLMRKPTRLDALQPVKSAKKKQSKYNSMDPL